MSEVQQCQGAGCTKEAKLQCPTCLKLNISGRQVPPHIERPDYADHPQGISKSEKTAKAKAFIKVLNKEEIEGVRTVCKLAREVLDIGAATVKPGVTTDEIDRVIHEATIERDSYPSPLNYYEFPKSCCM
ncbi:hypothetical protein RhiirA1_428079 [Rhizophagus irregularis]|uniref:Peptidase M24 domain-containing protein n=1 Tax=Rhizophagus irregularis TaxID=588596 RepID=A0A2N0R411_9GLOM|nr:hypothetical protein RhiirA1_428079 [Rhizophagus irregularis]